MEDEADQFLSLISENSQIKAEILSLREYDNAIRSLDRNIMKVFTNEVIGSEHEPADMTSLIAKVRVGLTPVVSAETFKERMKLERIMKICDAQRSKMEELSEKVAASEKRKSDLETSIGALQAKIEEHHKVIKEAQTIKENFSKQIELINAAMERTLQERDALAEKVAQEQAMGLDLRRSIEQSKRNVSMLRSQQND